MSFSADIANYAQKTGLSIDKAVVSVCAQATTSIIKRTPIDTGRARGNWYPSIDMVSSETSETRTSGEAIASGIATAQKASGHIFNLTNNLPYINGLEMGNSKQAPLGMVRLTAEEIEKQLSNFARG